MLLQATTNVAARLCCVPFCCTTHRLNPSDDVIGFLFAAVELNSFDFEFGLWHKLHNFKQCSPKGLVDLIVYLHLMEFQFELLRSHDFEFAGLSLHNPVAHVCITTLVRIGHIEDFYVFPSNAKLITSFASRYFRPPSSTSAIGVDPKG